MKSKLAKLIFITLIASTFTYADVLLDDFKNQFGGANDQCGLGEAYGFATWGPNHIDSGGGWWRPYADTLGTLITNGSGVPLESGNYSTMVEDTAMHVFFKTHLSSCNQTDTGGYALAGIYCDFMGDTLQYFDFSDLTEISIKLKGKGIKARNWLRILLQTKDIYEMVDSNGVQVGWGYYGYTLRYDSTFLEWKELKIPAALLDPEIYSPAADCLWTWVPDALHPEGGGKNVKGFAIQAIPDDDTLTNDSSEVYVREIIFKGLDYYKVFGFEYIEPPHLIASPKDSTHFVIDTTITLSTALTGAEIYYTTDGIDPDTSNATQLYSVPFTISGDTVTVKAAVVFNEMILESKRWTYFRDYIYIVITADPGDSSHFEIDTSITLTTDPADATIHYTLDGTVPTSASPLYTGLFTIDQSLTVKAMAYKIGYIGVYRSWNYICDLLAAWITANPGDSTLFGEQLEIKLTTNSDSIYYTIDGSDPLTNGTQYAGPFTISGDTVVVKAITIGEGYDTTTGSWTYFGNFTNIKSNTQALLCKSLSMKLSRVTGNTLIMTVGIPNKNPPSAKITLFDLSGRKIVGQSVNGYGYHRIVFNRNLLSSGVYLVRLVNGKEANNYKLILQ